ncbi:MAG: hypothetical protein GXY15_04800 [Candidatus Hydrogenedentes bacterium]|nr:hypothetical protein [Candidatus Hydrogenedentota bacterium]
MNRRAFLAGVSALSLGLPRLCRAAEDGPRLRVATYNIHHAEGTDGRLDLDRIAGILRELDADVVCLQEVDRNQPRTEKLDMPSLFAEKLKMTSAYGVNYQFSGGDYGVLTLTRLPLLAQKNTPLANPEGVAEPRGCLTVTVRWQDREVDIHNTHLGLSPKERAAQVEDVLPLFRPDTPTLLLGDLNEGPDGPAVARLREKLADTFTGPKDEGSLPGAKKARRIDFILASPHFQTVESVVHVTGTTRTASDHFPCRAALAWRDPVPATP